MFIIILACYLLYEIYPEFNKIITCVIALLLIMLAGFRAPGVDNDSFQYYFIFEHVRFFQDVYSGRTDLMALLIPYLLKFFGIYSFTLTLLCFASIAVFFKTRAFIKFSPIPILSILVYFSFYFIKQEMTTIRAGIAVAIMLWSIEDIEPRNYISFYIKIFVACLFHLSAIVFVLLIFINTKKLNKSVYFLLFNLGFIIAILHIDFISHLPLLGNMFSKVQYYSLISNSVAGGASANFISVINLFYMFLFNIYIYYSDFLYQKDRYAIIFVKLSIYAFLLLFFFFRLSGVVAGRLNEMYGIVINISLLYLIYLFKPRWLMIMFIIVYAIYFFDAIIYRNPLLREYTTGFGI